jgi:hypothetical protein
MINQVMRHFRNEKYVILNEKTGDTIHMGKWRDNGKFYRIKQNINQFFKYLIMINELLRYFIIDKYVILNEETDGMIHQGKWRNTGKFHPARSVY